MKNTIIGSITALLVSFLLTSPAFSHCEIPCGIYEDEMRFNMIQENITTIEKSMKSILELSKEADKNYNQIVRWVDNKDEHANKIQHIVSQYFMTQRIKPVSKQDEKNYSEYVRKLTLLHEMLVYAMKSKQTTDLANVEKLRSLLSDFKSAYASTK